jgi:hypothetical protein
MEGIDAFNVRDLGKRIALFEDSSFSPAFPSDGSNIEKFMWGLDGVIQEEKASSSETDVSPCGSGNEKYHVD